MLHSELSIYKVAYDLFHKVVTITRSMPRDFRNTVGDKLRGEALEMVMLVFRANSARDKRPHLDMLIERQVCAGLLLRLAVDMRFISTTQYAEAVELTNSIGRQANGWRKAQK